MFDKPESQNSTSSEHPQLGHAVSLAVRNSDGSVWLHPALAISMWPGLNQTGPDIVPVYSENSPDQIPETWTSDNPKEAQKTKVITSDSLYSTRRQLSSRQGRVWSSWIRRLIRTEDIDRYAAMQRVALAVGMTVTDVRLYVELHSKRAKQRGRSMRRNLVWKKHLSGVSDKAIAGELGIHPKTVASDRKAKREETYVERP